MLVLLNALEITIEERPLALEVFLDGEDDPSEIQQKTGFFSIRNGPPCGATSWCMPYSTRICIPLIAQAQ